TAQINDVQKCLEVLAQVDSKLVTTRKRIEDFQKECAECVKNNREFDKEKNDYLTQHNAITIAHYAQIDKEYPRLSSLSGALARLNKSETFKAFNRYKANIAQLEILRISFLIKQFSAQVGRYPDSIRELQANTNAKIDANDPWGRPYEYDKT